MNTPWITTVALSLALAAPGQAPESPVPAAAVASETKPRAVFEKIELDAGEVTRGQDLPFTFLVKNTGDAVLKILSAKPG